MQDYQRNHFWKGKKVEKGRKELGKNVVWLRSTLHLHGQDRLVHFDQCIPWFPQQMHRISLNTVMQLSPVTTCNGFHKPDHDNLRDEFWSILAKLSCSLFRSDSRLWASSCSMVELCLSILFLLWSWNNRGKCFCFQPTQKQVDARLHLRSNWISQWKSQDEMSQVARQGCFIFEFRGEGWVSLLSSRETGTWWGRRELLALQFRAGVSLLPCGPVHYEAELPLFKPRLPFHVQWGRGQATKLQLVIKRKSNWPFFACINFADLQPWSVYFAKDSITATAPRRKNNAINNCLFWLEEKHSEPLTNILLLAIGNI